MAYSINRKKIEAARVNRTPAPDEITNIRNPKGIGYGANGPQPSSVAPGTAVESPLGANLRQSSDDGENLLGKIIAGGLRGDCPDNIPDVSDEQRTVSAGSYPLSFGMRNRSDPAKAEKIPGAIDKSDRPSPAEPSQQ